MANAPIIFPTVWKPKIPNCGINQLSALNSNTAIPAQSFVLNASGLWVKYASAGIIVAGLMMDAGVTQANAAIAEPFNALYGPNHNPIDPRSCYFLMNLTDGSGAEGSGSTTHADVVLGRYCGAIYGATTTNSLMINAASDVVTPTSASGLFWKVVGFYNTSVAVDGDASTDFNGRVIVEIDQIGLQAAL